MHPTLPHLLEQLHQVGYQMLQQHEDLVRRELVLDLREEELIQRERELQALQTATDRELQALRGLQALQTATEQAARDPVSANDRQATSVFAASTEQVAGELQALQTAGEQAAEQPAKHLVSANDLQTALAAVGSGSRDELQALQTAVEQPARNLDSEDDRARGQRMLDGLRLEREKRWHRERVAALEAALAASQASAPPMPVHPAVVLPTASPPGMGYAATRDPAASARLRAAALLGGNTAPFAEAAPGPKASAPVRMAGELQALQTAGEQAAEQPARYLASWTAAAQPARDLAQTHSAAAASTEQHAGEFQALESQANAHGDLASANDRQTSEHIAGEVHALQTAGKQAAKVKAPPLELVAKAKAQAKAKVKEPPLELVAIKAKAQAKAAQPQAPPPRGGWTIFR